MNTQSALMNFVRKNEPLCAHSTIKIGGTAYFFAVPATRDELLTSIMFAEDTCLPFKIIGNGSNLLFSDTGYPGIIISLKRFEMDHLSFSKTQAGVSAGVMMPVFASECARQGFSGVEFMCNIPGTIGGGLIMNASFGGEDISSVVDSVTVLDLASHEFIKIQKKDLQFFYRKLNLGSAVIVDAVFNLKESTPKKVLIDMQKNIETRKISQPLSRPSLGCFFKNPIKIKKSAGQLIDECGLKRFSIGGASVSSKHANYIVNKGDAKSTDVLKLIRHVQLVVKKVHGVRLELEIEYVC